MRNKALLILVSLLISTAVFILVFFITYTVACALAPPYIDIDGERHPTMPMGQAFVGIILGVMFGIVSLFISYKKLKKY